MPSRKKEGTVARQEEAETRIHGPARENLEASEEEARGGQ